MKKLFCLLLTIILICCCGCTKLSGNLSSGEDGIDAFISDLDSLLSEQQDAGEVSIIESTYSYYEDNSSSLSGSSGAQTVIIDPSLIKDDATDGALADVAEIGDKPLYFSSLNYEQKRIYRIIKFMAVDMIEETRSLGAATDLEVRINDISIAFKALVSDCPEMFWLPYVYSISEDGTLFSFEGKFEYTKSQVNSMKLKLNKVIKSIKIATNGLSRFEKELYIHDYICKNTKYNTSPDTLSFTSYGALVEGQAVCEGYSKAMQLLCDNTGVPCTVIYGTSKGQGHMWNIIDPGDGWYHLDVTWDDLDSKSFCHYYFNLNDTQIAFDHDIAPVTKNTDVSSTVDLFNISRYYCNATSYNYYQRKNLIFGEDLREVASIVVTNSSKGEKSVELLYQNSLGIAEALNNVQKIITEAGYSEIINDYTVLGNAVILRW